MVEDYADDHNAHTYFCFSCLLEIPKTTLNLSAASVSAAARTKFLLCTETVCAWGGGVYVTVKQDSKICTDHENQ